MKIIRNNIIPFKGYKLLNLFGVIFARKDADITEKDLNHEQIHTAQIKETLWIGFYLWYIIEYLMIHLSGIFTKQNDKYHDVSFEEEAYANEKDLKYLENRKRFAWLKYVKLGSYKNN